jgi:hypothetical protein
MAFIMACQVLSKRMPLHKHNLWDIPLHYRVAAVNDIDKRFVLLMGSQ